MKKKSAVEKDFINFTIPPTSTNQTTSKNQTTPTNEPTHSPHSTGRKRLR